MPRPKRVEVQQRAPKELNDAHKSMAVMAAHGATQKEIAEHFGYHASSISAIFSSPLFQALVERERDNTFRAETKTRLRKIVREKSVKTIEDLHESENDFLRLSAAKTAIGLTLTSADAEAKAEAAKEAANKGTEIRITFSAEDIAQLRAGDIEPPADYIDITPTPPIKSVKELLAELSAQEREATEHP